MTVVVIIILLVALVLVLPIVVVIRVIVNLDNVLWQMQLNSFMDQLLLLS